MRPASRTQHEFYNLKCFMYSLSRGLPPLQVPAAEKLLKGEVAGVSLVG